MTDHQTSPVGEDAERAAFVAWMKARPGYPFAGAYANLMWDAWQGARRAVPALDASGLPHVKTWQERMTAEGLYDVDGRLFGGWTGEMMARTAETLDLRKQVDDLRAQLAATTAKNAAVGFDVQKVHMTAPTQPKAQVGSIDTPEFRALVRKLLTDHNQMINGPAGTALIAYIDAWAGSRTGDAVPTDMFYGQRFLSWNRGLPKPPVAIGMELGVARKVMELAADPAPGKQAGNDRGGVTMWTERKTIRRKGQALFYDAISDRRRPAYERRGTVPGLAPPTREQQLYGERRKRPGME